jgi:single-strand DNA-binding protein
MDTRNVVVLIGRLVADPELKYLSNGTPVANFAIAVNRSIPKGDGFEESLDGFFDCEAFGGTAVALAETLTKGDLTQVTGSLLQKKFEAKGGHKVNKVEIRVRNIGQVLIGKSENGNHPAGRAVEEAPAPQPA